MAIIKAKSYLQEYKIRAKKQGVSAFSGRIKKEHLTKYINSNIVSSLDFKNKENILDIGCGDLTLLKLLDKKLKFCKLFGTVRTRAEEEELKSYIKTQNFSNKITVKQAFSSRLSFENNSMDKVIINGVVVLLSKRQIIRTLKEILRVCKKNAYIYMGEVPFMDELKEINYGYSIVKWWWHSLKKRGFKYLLFVINMTFKAFVPRALGGGEDMILSAKKVYYYEVEEFTALCESLGFKVEKKFRSKIVDMENNELLSNSRYDYILSIKK